MNLDVLFSESMIDEVPKLLADGKYKLTDLVKLASGVPIEGGAMMTLISKDVTFKKEEALVYLFQRLLVNSELLPSSPPYPDGKSFLKLLQQEQVLTTALGNERNAGSVALFYETLENEVKRSNNGEYLLNDEPFKEVSLLKEENILSATVFADDWNEKLYFIETTKDWYLLSWFTDV